MLIVRMQGGLGNQLFQYAQAIGRCDKPMLDTLAYRGHVRSLALEKFPIQARSLGSIGSGWSTRLWYRLSKRVGDGCRVRELEIHGEPIGEMDLESRWCGITWLSGYWQQNDWSDAVCQRLRKELVKPSLAEGVGGPSCVAVHARYGDYVNDGRVRAVHGNLSPDYYQRAWELIHAQNENVTAVIFSDEPERARNEILPGVTREIVSGRSAENDLQSMATCGYHIIANSTFSWWGAWLSGVPGRRICAPAQWHACPEDWMIDPVPSDWLRI